MNIDRTLNVALAGFGYAGKTFHAPLITCTPGLHLHTMISRRPDAVHPHYPMARVVADLSSALDDPAIDMVVIASPNDVHYPQASAALAAGRHVVVDKPFTTTLAEATQLQAQAERTGNVLSVFHNRRWDADFLAIAPLIKQQAFGQISHFESRLDRYRPQPRQRWREEDRPGGGLWFDLGPHLLDQALCLFGMPEAVQGHLLSQRQGANVNDCFDVRLCYPGFLASLHASCLVPGPSPRFIIHGSQASLIKWGVDPQEHALQQGIAPDTLNFGKDPQPATFWQAEGDKVRESTLESPAGSHITFYQQVRAAILGLAPNPVTAAQAIDVMRVLECVAQSAAQGQQISL